MKANKGFTLIELVVVIVILGILAVSAIPRFVDLSQEASQAAVEGVAGALSSGSAINYATCKADSANADCETIDTCADAAVLFQGGAMPTGYQFNDGSVTIADDASGVCTIESVDDATINADATVLGT